MNFFTVLLMSVGLAMDAFAVSVTNGMLIAGIKFKHAFKIAAFFGFFQAVMPIVGWLAGINFRNFIGMFDHWVALILLGFIGGKMVRESFEMKKESCPTEDQKKHDIDNKTLLMLAVATSIDALAAGLSFAILSTSIIEASVLIGFTTFLICFAGVLIGKKCNILLKSRAELTGGIILIIIGLEIFAKDTGILSSFLSYLILKIQGL
ncbi:MAG TPA: manganese efflux pump [Clostridiaceae bacterium]|nr:manganese efflux pump [Clostridiaceae bacterium]